MSLGAHSSHERHSLTNRTVSLRSRTPSISVSLKSKPRPSRLVLSRADRDLPSSTSIFRRSSPDFTLPSPPSDLQAPLVNNSLTAFPSPSHSLGSRFSSLSQFGFFSLFFRFAIISQLMFISASYSLSLSLFTCFVPFDSHDRPAHCFLSLVSSLLVSPTLLLSIMTKPLLLFFVCILSASSLEIRVKETKSFAFDEGSTRLARYVLALEPTTRKAN